jgi:hypothetical protein
MMGDPPSVVDFNYPDFELYDDATILYPKGVFYQMNLEN